MLIGEITGICRGKSLMNEEHPTDGHSETHGEFSFILTDAYSLPASFR